MCIQKYAKATVLKQPIILMSPSHLLEAKGVPVFTLHQGARLPHTGGVLSLRVFISKVQPLATGVYAFPIGSYYITGS